MKMQEKIDALRVERKDIADQLEASESRNQILDQRNAELVIREDDLQQIIKRKNNLILKLELLLKEYL